MVGLTMCVSRLPFVLILVIATCLGAARQPARIFKLVGERLGEFDRSGKLVRKPFVAGYPQGVRVGKTACYVAYNLDDTGGLSIVECSRSGAVRHVHRINDATIARATDAVAAKALSRGRILAELHINPWDSAYVEVDLKTGRHRTFIGYFGEWDNAQRHFAYFREEEHGPEPLGALYVDGRRLCYVSVDHSERLVWKNGILHARFATPEGKQRLLRYDVRTGRQRMGLVRG